MTTITKAYRKDIFRTIKRTRKRFLSILVITALGVGMLTGLHAACLDMYASADQFYDEQDLFDIRVMSTLGLTEDDVEILSQLSDVEQAEGGYSETVYTEVGPLRQTAAMTVLSPSGMNLPYLTEGKLPAAVGEIAVTEAYIEASGKTIGDTITIEEDLDNDSDGEASAGEAGDAADPDDSKTPAVITDEEDELDINIDIDDQETANFLYNEYIITGIVIDPMDVSNNNGAMAFRSTAATDYTFFITEDNVESDIYTVIYLTLNSTSGLNCYSDEYEKIVQNTVSYIESQIKEQREAARYDAVYNEAADKLFDAQQMMDEKFAETEEKIADARQEIDDAKIELADGEQTLEEEEADALEQIASAWADIASAEKKLADAARELADGKAELVLGQAELEKNQKILDDGKAQLQTERQNALTRLEDGQKQLDAAKLQLENGKQEAEAGYAQLKDNLGELWPEQEWQALVNAASSLTANGSDESAAVSGTASESQALMAVLNNSVSAMKAALDMQLNQMKAAAEAIDENLPQVSQSLEYLSIQRDQAENQLDAAAGLLSQMEEGSEEYMEQSYVVESLSSALTGLQENISILETSCAEMTAQKSELSAYIHQIQTQSGQLDQIPSSGVQVALGLGMAEGGQIALNQQQVDFNQQKQSALAALDSAQKELDNGQKAIDAGWQEIRSGFSQLESGEKELASGWTEFEDGKKRLQEEEADALRQIQEGWDELNEGKEELAEGESELEEKEQEFLEKKEDALQKIAEAWEELDDLDMTQWYVQDRTSLDSYSSLQSDLSSIDAVGKAFPVIFLAVAILISLTTMTRMVEEERGLMGTYKAMGFTDLAIYGKYIIYALLACLLGGIAGDLFGFIFLPLFVSVIMDKMYLVPAYYLQFDALYGIGGILLFMVGIVGATALTCFSELKQMPASLMRPRAPKAGSRVFLEHMPAVWKRLKFLNKVTMRNLFRYKKRLLMTIAGIMGCTALVLAGFAIRDSVTDLMPKQYEQTYIYDLMLVADEKDYQDLEALMETQTEVSQWTGLRIETVKLQNKNGDVETVQLMVIPSGAAVEDYIGLRDTGSQPVTLTSQGIYITQNASEILNMKTGDEVYIQDLKLNQYEVTITEVVQNYLGNNIYITEEYYESLTGGFKPNSALVLLSDTCEDHRLYADTLAGEDYILASSSTQAMKEDFTENFALINAVLYLIICMAAGLAFVVLFTLSNTNISERIRELATIKVLGFYDGEVHQYVNKETLILTGLGVLLGLPAGRVLSGLLTKVLQLPSIYFAVHIEPASYILAAAFSFGFAVVVNLIMNKTLDKVNMVEALKSVE